jgi:sterol desaturase/sphingolipid hydroxylase (fatty acid hydroxylase superfamily)
MAEFRRRRGQGDKGLGFVSAKEQLTLRNRMVRRISMHAHTFPHWLSLFIVGAVAAEIAWYVLVQKRSYPWREMFASIGISVMRVPVKAMTSLLVLPVAFFLYSHRVATVPLNTAWGLGLLLLAEEFAYYWMHRAGHEVRWLWASHVVHHTPEHIHLASAFRIGITEFFSGTWLFFPCLSGCNPQPLVHRF